MEVGVSRWDTLYINHQYYTRILAPSGSLALWPFREVTVLVGDSLVWCCWWLGLFACIAIVLWSSLVLLFRCLMLLGGRVVGFCLSRMSVLGIVYCLLAKCKHLAILAMSILLWKYLKAPKKLHIYSTHFFDLIYACWYWPKKTANTNTHGLNEDIEYVFLGISTHLSNKIWRGPLILLKVLVPKYHTSSESEDGITSKLKLVRRRWRRKWLIWVLQETKKGFCFIQCRSWI